MRFKSDRQRKAVMAKVKHPIYKVRENGHYFYTTIKRKKGGKVLVFPFHLRKVKSIMKVKRPTTWQRFEAYGDVNA
jgi:hypothetical protein